MREQGVISPVGDFLPGIPLAIKNVGDGRGVTGFPERTPDSNRELRKGRTPDPSELVPSGKRTTGIPPPRGFTILRNWAGTSAGLSRLTKIVPALRASHPKTGQGLDIALRGEDGGTERTDHQDVHIAEMIARDESLGGDAS